jgi:membrane dipeptidase
LEGSFDVLDLFFNEVRKVPQASIVLNKRDLPTQPEPGTLKFIMEIEGGHPFQEDYSSGLPMHRRLHLFRTFFRLGMRHLHIAHNGRNELADGHNDEITGGRLSEFGVAVVKEANRLGVTMTLGHLAEPCWFHVLEVSEQPVLCTHSTRRRPRPAPPQRHRCPDQGGGGAGGCRRRASVEPHPGPDKPTLDELVATCATWPICGAAIHRLRRPEPRPQLPQVEPPGDPRPDLHAGRAGRRRLPAGESRCSSSASDRAGFTQDDVRGILGGNYLRVFRHNLPEDSVVYWDYRR